MILEDLGPKHKIFEDLEVGDYLFEVGKPNDWLSTFADKTDEEATITYINWQLRVLEPSEQEGRVFFHRTMYSASPEKIAQAKKPYDPTSFTYQFFAAIGAGIVNSGEVTILDEYLTDGNIDLDKMVGMRFWGSLREVADRKDPSIKRVQLTKCWSE